LVKNLKCGFGKREKAIKIDIWKYGEGAQGGKKKGESTLKEESLPLYWREESRSRKSLSLRLIDRRGSVERVH